MASEEGSKKNTCKADGRPVRLAVFDFDGTSIMGSSPVLLVRYLVKHKMLKKRTVFQILLWAFAYKFRLPQNETWVRGLVFSAFCGKSKKQVDQYLKDFYDECIEGRFRPQAEHAMRAHEEAGHEVWVISATFEPIIERAMQFHSFCHQISTRMKVDASGNYTCSVEGDPIEGEQKLHALKQQADQLYGLGKWELSFAYGDHHSDIPMLTASKNPHAVSPDNPLQRMAKREDWPILNWDKALD